MKVNQEINIETEVPFCTIYNFSSLWEINHHAELELSGLINSHKAVEVLENIYIGTRITLSLEKESAGDDEPILFHGQIEKLHIKKENGIQVGHLKAKSGSIELDRRAGSESFQDPDLTYTNIAKKIVSSVDGSIICTTKGEAINKPIIRYKETEWEFLKRIASHQGSYLISDVKTGNAAIWFGMRQGKKISEDPFCGITETIIEIEYQDKGKKSINRNHESFEVRRNYYLGDWVEDKGIKKRISCRLINFEKGDIRFFYKLSTEKDLQTKKFFNDKIIGLSLYGTVEEAKSETIKIKYDMDQKEGKFYYPWRPETGNALYAVPEIGAKVAVLFTSHDERGGIAVRCVDLSSEERSEGNKYIKTPDHTHIQLQTKRIELRKGGEELNLNDNNEIAFSGKKVEIEASGSVKLKAKRIVLSAGTEISATAE